MYLAWSQWTNEFRVLEPFLANHLTKPLQQLTTKIRHDVFYICILYAEREGKKSRVNQVGGREL